MMLCKFEFVQCRGTPRISSLRTNDFRLQRCMFVEKIRKSGIIAVNKIREFRWGMSDKTRRKNVKTEVVDVDRTYRTNKTFR